MFNDLDYRSTVQVSDVAGKSLLTETPSFPSINGVAQQLGHTPGWASKMTTKARVVLQDAKYAIQAHTGTLQAEHFRISWIAVVTLLRAVGHVLKNVDSLESPARKAAIEQKRKELNSTKPEPKIYWEFILLERNRFLKEYVHGVRRELTVPGPAFKGTETTIRIDVGNRGGGGGGPVSGLQSTISSGPFAGQSERAIAWQAYDWWVSYLDEIDAITAGNDA